MTETVRFCVHNGASEIPYFVNSTPNDECETAQYCMDKIMMLFTV